MNARRFGSNQKIDQSGKAKESINSRGNGKPYDSYPLAAILAERRYLKIKEGLAQVSLDTAAKVSKKLERTMSRAIHASGIADRLPSTCRLWV